MHNLYIGFQYHLLLTRFYTIPHDSGIVYTILTRFLTRFQNRVGWDWNRVGWQPDTILQS